MKFEMQILRFYLVGQYYCKVWHSIGPFKFTLMRTNTYVHWVVDCCNDAGSINPRPKYLHPVIYNYDCRENLYRLRFTPNIVFSFFFFAVTSDLPLLYNVKLEINIKGCINLQKQNANTTLKKRLNESIYFLYKLLKFWINTL